MGFDEAAFKMNGNWKEIDEEKTYNCAIELYYFPHADVDESYQQAEP